MLFFVRRIVLFLSETVTLTRLHDTRSDHAHFMALVQCVNRSDGDLG